MPSMQAALPPVATSIPAWRIRRGWVDLFLARLEAGRTPGARRHVGRAREGGAVFSPKPAHGYCLVLEPSSSAELEDATVDSLTRGELDAWVACLGCPADPAANLEQFHDRALARLAGIAGESESRAAERIRERSCLDRSSLVEARRALSGILDSRNAETSLPSSGDPLVCAASAVCRAAGIVCELKPAGRESALLDPVELLARANRLRMRRVSLAGDWWTRDAGPLVGYLAESRQPVALLPRGGHYICWNPSGEGAPRVTRSLASTLAGTAFSFYRPFPAGRVTLWTLLTFASRGMKRDGGIVLFTGALASAAAMVTPVATGVVFDTIVPSADSRQLARIFVILVAAAAATTLLNLARNLALLRIESRVDASLQAALWDRLLSLPATFFRGYSAGDLAQRSLAISHIRELLAGTAIPSLLAGVFSISSFALMFFYGGPGLALPAAAIVTASFAVTVAAGAAQVRLQRRLAAAAGRVSGLLPQLLAGVTKLRAAAAEQRAFARWAAAFSRQKSIAAAARRLRTGLEIFFPAFQAAAMIFLFQMLGRQDGVSSGSFFAFQSAFLQVLMGASQAGSALVTILAVVPHYERAKPLLDAIPEAASGALDPGELQGGVELVHVSFRYRPDLPPVLQDLSVRITPGEFVAIVGPSGSGKSTVLRLLLGFEKPESGSLFYDGQDLAGLDAGLVRRQIGAVLQQGRVLSGSVYSNIAGATPLSMDAAWEAARLAGLDQDLRNMPMGMHTLVAEGGAGLSGGQIQRLQIARALARRPRIVLFDEATSALDNRTQSTVMESLARLDVTRIVVAHRLSTIRGARRIFVMDRGSVAEAGSYDELMERGGLFTQLARRQLS